jgi:protein-S-isoprenylcysteine O-methyltransferase Ste14
MRALDLKVPPLAVVLLTAVLMAVTAWAAPAMALVIPYSERFGVLLALLGAAISISGVSSFRRAGTTVNPLKPGTSSTLVSSGVYKLTRNPMYLGFLLLLAGWAVYLSNALVFVFLPLFVLYITRFQIKPEERALTSRFGEEFVDYTKRVRRWL